MPVHDWKKEDPGLFHAFHLSWTTHLFEALMDGLLPKGYTALPEQYFDELWPDVLTLRDEAIEDPSPDGLRGPAVKTAKPKAYHIARHEDDAYISKQRRIVVRDRKNRRIVAVIEIVSPSNKKAPQGVEQFLTKSVELLAKGINLVVIDVLRPTKSCPVSFHNLIWQYRYAKCDYAPPPGRKLSVVSYDAHATLEAYREPMGVGDPMPSIPLFLLGGTHLELPLEETANRAMRFLPFGS